MAKFTSSPAGSVGEEVTYTYNKSDFIALEKHLLKKEELTGSALLAADYNKDGYVDILDLLALKKYLSDK